MYSEGLSYEAMPAAFRSVLVFGVANGVLTKSATTPAGTPPLSIAVHPTGKLALVAKTLKKVKLSTTILGYSMAFNNPADAFHGPKSGVTVFQIQPNGSYKEVYAAG